MQRHNSGPRAASLWAFLPAILLSLTPAKADPDPQEILRQARLNHISQEAQLTARLRSGTLQIPFLIRLQNGEVSYQFSEPSEEIILRLREEDSELLLRQGSQLTTIEGARGAEKIQQTSLTYEDLALRFLYWPGAKYLGRDSLRNRPTHRIELHPHRKNSLYGAVRIWVDEASGALLRIEGYDWQGKLVRRFEVLTVQKIEGQWFLRTMRIENYDPATGKVANRLYLDITGVPETAPPTP
jgi:hypothetical protein